jgi:hypothetical protein
MYKSKGHVLCRKSKAAAKGVLTAEDVQHLITNKQLAAETQRAYDTQLDKAQVRPML